MLPSQSAVILAYTSWSDRMPRKSTIAHIILSVRQIQERQALQTDPE
jgi:hypothetical protein